MKRRHAMLLAAVLLVVGTASFVSGRLVASRRQSESKAFDWLHDAPVRVQDAEHRFEQHVRQLTQTVIAHKSDLAAMLADPDSTDVSIVRQVDHVLQANTALVRAVGAHLVGLRDSLPPRPRQRLMESCVDSLQSRVQRRYRLRGGASNDTGRQGRGNGYGEGRGQGGYGPAGRQYRGGRGSGDTLADKLQLTAEQVAFANRNDPDFSVDCTRLKEEVSAAYAALLAGLEDAQAGDDELLARLDGLIEAHNRLELRVAQFVVMVRPWLSAAQRQRLAGLSRGGPSFRRGRSASNGVGPIGFLEAGGFFGQIVIDAI
jgi:hypothetical protein